LVLRLSISSARFAALLPPLLLLLLVLPLLWLPLFEHRRFPVTPLAATLAAAAAAAAAAAVG